MLAIVRNRKLLAKFWLLCMKAGVPISFWCLTTWCGCWILSVYYRGHISQLDLVVVWEEILAGL